MVDGGDVGKLVSDDCVAHTGSPDGQHAVWFCAPVNTPFGEWMDPAPTAVLVVDRPGFASEAKCFRSFSAALAEFGVYIERFNCWHALGEDPWKGEEKRT